MKKIKLTKGKYVTVDNDMFGFLNQWKWFYSNGYAARFVYLGGGRKNAKYKMIFMHRLINETPEGYETDHINRNKLNNRKINLRIADRSLNSRNKSITKNNTSGYKGIDFYKRIGKWRARISLNKITFSLGYYKNIERAVAAREEAEWKMGWIK